MPDEDTQSDADTENGEEAEDMLEELLDRFGEPPKSVQNLLAVAELKASPAYQRVAPLIEGVEAPVFGGLTQ